MGKILLSFRPLTGRKLFRDTKKFGYRVFVFVPWRGVICFVERGIIGKLVKEVFVP